ncbi:MAG: hypothetical protein KF744_01870 [Taibaiella sp.]|nr:hypothetical protein [Taibaiella sp.]
MKKIAGILALAIVCTAAQAQNKHNLFVDANFIYTAGASATYDRKVLDHLDIGAGLNSVYFYKGTVNSVYSAGYIDIRPYWGKRKHMWFVKLDGGIANYTRDQKPSVTITPFGAYCALAYGYQYHINARGQGPYATIGFNGYSQSFHSTNTNLPPQARDYSVFDATNMLFVGFKF